MDFQRFLRTIPLILVLLTALACPANSEDIKTLTKRATAETRKPNSTSESLQGGQGVPQDYKEAVKWLRKAATREYRCPINWSMYQGLRGPAGLQRSRQMFRNAARRLMLKPKSTSVSPTTKGGASSRFRRGDEVVSQGREWGISCPIHPRNRILHRAWLPIDYAEAAKWFRKPQSGEMRMPSFSEPITTAD